MRSRMPMKGRRRRVAAAVAIACACAACRAEPAREAANAGGELLVTGGTVVTMDAARTVIERGAVAIDGGRIAAVGPAGELEASHPHATRIDAGGGIILPGLINAHTHAAMVLFRGLADDLDLMDWLEGHIFPAEAEYVDEEFVRVGTRLACLEMLRGGTTTMVDLYYYEDAVAEEIDRCGMRGVLGQTVIGFPAPDFASVEETLAAARRFAERWRGHPRVVAALAPHALYTLSAEQMKAVRELATELDVPMLTHLAEDRSEIERMQARAGKRSIAALDE